MTWTTAPPGPTAVYRLYNADGTPLYFGITNNPERRFEQHAYHKDWWPDVATKKVEWFEDRKGAMRAEAEAIEDEEPLYNRTGEKYEKRRIEHQIAEARARAERFPPGTVIEARALWGDYC